MRKHMVVPVPQQAEVFACDGCDHYQLVSATPESDTAPAGWYIVQGVFNDGTLAPPKLFHRAKCLEKWAIGEKRARREDEAGERDATKEWGSVSE